ncbi:MAG: FtsW/RodA/SpoVE family cell cycle protein [Coriobacteriaceae bacterium]|nr:FtsW/RodA/SpoVE family cell cycle protein [Coriobacteriaceae bacterium]
MNMRTTELLLLLAASPVIILLFVLAIVNDGVAVTIRTLAVPLGLFVAFLLSHLAIRRFAPNADPAILPISFMLSGIGIAFVMRLAPELAERQILWLFLAVAAMVLTLIAVPSIHRLSNYKYTIMIIGIILLLLPALIGTEHYGSKIWLNIGTFSFQPGEIAKVMIVLFLAAYLAQNREMLSASKRKAFGLSVPDLRTLDPLLVMWAICMLIVVFERDLGSALLFFGLFLVMIYVATGRKTYVLAGAGLAVIGGVAAFLLFGHVQQRVEIWLDPFAYAQESGYQLVQAIYSLADGNLFGTGIGRGLPTLIPVVESDFIFVAIAEEMGLLGASGVLLLYMLFAIRGLTIAGRAKSDVDAFTAVGLTAAISLQALVIVGGVTRIIPLTGVTLPFMSQGGSSLLASFIIVGLLLRAGNSATGIEQELQSTVALDGGVLGRVALGRRLTILVSIFAVFFAILIGNLTWVMVAQAEEIRALPTNNHTLMREQDIQRGSIVTADGMVLAQSLKEEDGGYVRDYPQGSLAAHLVGYYSTQYGSSGVESSQSESLTGKRNFSTWSDAINSLAGNSVPGNDVQLTIDSRIQAAAEAALAGETGAVVVLEAESGKVLGLASGPTYDINQAYDLLAPEGDDGSGSLDKGSALFNRATQALYAPGSTFKTVTLAAALSTAGASLDDEYSAPGSIEIGNAKITNFNEEDLGQITLKRAFELSSNTVFAQVADTIGAQNLVKASEGFGFNKHVGMDFSAVNSLMPDPAQMTDWETAWSGVGQPVGEHSSPAGPQTTVLQMAMVGAAFANEGTIMSPYVVDRLISASGAVLSTTSPSTFAAAVSPSVAKEVNSALAGVVNSGTGTAAQISGYNVVGKTGTAQTNNEQDDSWFMGYVTIGDKNVVVAIVIEQTDGGAATPKARQIFEAAIRALE